MAIKYINLFLLTLTLFLALNLGIAIVKNNKSLPAKAHAAAPPGPKNAPTVLAVCTYFKN